MIAKTSARGVGGLGVTNQHLIKNWERSELPDNWEMCSGKKRP